MPELSHFLSESQLPADVSAQMHCRLQSLPSSVQKGLTASVHAIRHKMPIARMAEAERDGTNARLPQSQARVGQQALSLFTRSCSFLFSYPSTESRGHIAYVLPISSRTQGARGRQDCLVV